MESRKTVVLPRYRTNQYESRNALTCRRFDTPMEVGVEDRPCSSCWPEFVWDSRSQTLTSLPLHVPFAPDRDPKASLRVMEPFHEAVWTKVLVVLRRSSHLQ